MADGLTEILTLKKQDGTKVYPRTVTDAIIDKEGRYLTDLLGDLTSIQLEDHDTVGILREKVNILEVQVSHKVDAEEGKGLSSNDFTQEYKDKIDGLHSIDILQFDLSNKVDKVEGKGLSTFDFDYLYKIKLDNLPNRSTLDEMFNEKVNKVPGKGLSSNDYTDADRSRLWNDVYNISQTRTYVEDSLSSKVDKVEGKQLSDENFTLEMREKLAGIEPNANKYDDTFIKEKLNTKVDKIYGKELSANDFTDKLKEKLENLPTGEEYYNHNHDDTYAKLIDFNDYKENVDNTLDKFNTDIKNFRYDMDNHTHTTDEIYAEINTISDENGYKISDETGSFTLEKVTLKEKLEEMDEFDKTHTHMGEEIYLSYGSVKDENGFSISDETGSSTIERITLPEALEDINNSLKMEIIRAKQAENSNANQINVLENNLNSINNEVTNIKIGITELRSAIDDKNNSLDSEINGIKELIGKEATETTPATGLIKDILDLQASTATNAQNIEKLDNTIKSLHSEIKEDGSLYLSIKEQQGETVTVTPISQSEVSVLNEDEITNLLLNI